MPTDATKCSYCGGYHTTGTTCIKGWFAIAPPDEAATLRGKLAEAERQRDEAVKLLREWRDSSHAYRDASPAQPCASCPVAEQAAVERVSAALDRTEAYLAGVQHG